MLYFDLSNCPNLLNLVSKEFYRDAVTYGRTSVTHNITVAEYEPFFHYLVRKKRWKWELVTSKAGIMITNNNATKFHHNSRYEHPNHRRINHRRIKKWMWEEQQHEKLMRLNIQIGSQSTTIQMLQLTKSNPQPRQGMPTQIHCRRLTRKLAPGWVASHHLRLNGFVTALWPKTKNMFQKATDTSGYLSSSIAWAALALVNFDNLVFTFFLPTWNTPRDFLFFMSLPSTWSK